MTGDSLQFVMDRLHAALPVDSLHSLDSAQFTSIDFLWRLLLAVFILAILLFLLQRFRRPFLQASTPMMHVLASQNLGHRQRAMLLRVGERTLLIGLGDGPPSLLLELDAKESAAFQKSGQREAASFQTILQGILPSRKVGSAEGESS